MNHKNVRKMNKRKEKKVKKWWSDLRLDEREDYINACIKVVDSAWNFEPNDRQLEQMYNWATDSK